jgi:hypothetical protein
VMSFRVRSLPDIASSPSRAKVGPTFPSVIAPARTSAFHMRAHESDAPHVDPLEAVLHRIEIPDETGAQHNPSVCTVSGDLRVVVRVLHGRHTTNYVARVSNDWELVEPAKVHVSGFGKGDLRWTTQAEDLRLFHWQDRLWAIAAVHDGGQPPTAIRQALLQFDESGAAVANTYVQLSSRHEKNWMPFVDKGRLRLVYSTDPLIVATVDTAYRAVPGAPLTHQSTGHIRGSSQLIPWWDGWLGIVHQVYRPPQHVPGHNRMLSDFWSAPLPHPVFGIARTIYIHRFAYFDGAMSRVMLGEPWYWKEPGIEFCAGLTWWKGGLVASFGVADKEAWLAEISGNTVMRTFSGVGAGAHG